MCNMCVYSDELTSGEAASEFDNGYPDTADVNLVSFWALDGVYNDSVGSNNATNSGSVFVKDIHRPSTSSTQQTIDISLLGSWDDFYYRVRFDSSDTDRTQALDSIAFVYASTDGRRIVVMRRF